MTPRLPKPASTPCCTTSNCTSAKQPTEAGPSKLSATGFIPVDSGFCTTSGLRFRCSVGRAQARKPPTSSRWRRCVRLFEPRRAEGVSPRCPAAVFHSLAVNWKHGSPTFREMCGTVYRCCITRSSIFTSPSTGTSMVTSARYVGRIPPLRNICSGVSGT